MDPKAALDMFHSLIEQTMGAGLFKKIVDLDNFRAAHHTLNEFVNTKSNINEKTVEVPG